MFDMESLRKLCAQVLCYGDEPSLHAVELSWDRSTYHWAQPSVHTLGLAGLRTLSRSSQRKATLQAQSIAYTTSRNRHTPDKVHWIHEALVFSWNVATSCKRVAFSGGARKLMHKPAQIRKLTCLNLLSVVYTGH